ncbi:MAG: IgGFc-binding protein [Chlorobi bacterium]|nr:IgGFc-binding protein [Chlorobiota bacterium]MBX7217603.1 IgGFc-binding protein [Candidatus Kapabacteria bacterium]
MLHSIHNLRQASSALAIGERFLAQWIVRLLLLVALPVLAVAQVRPPDSIRIGGTTEGREFWVVFQKNFRDWTPDEATGSLKKAEPLELHLFITSSKRAQGTIEIEGIRFRKDFTVNAGQVIAISIDTAAQLRASDKAQKLAVHITSDEPISVYGLSHRYQTTDTYLAYPVDVLGTSYRAVGYGWLANDLVSQIAIIGTEDETTITVTPTTPIGRDSPRKPPYPKGKPFQITVNRGEVYPLLAHYNVLSTSDLTGTLIEADKPVAVFSGHNCAYVPDNNIKACNLLVEQLPPIRSWGRQFFVGTMAGRTSSVVRAVATEDSTLVYENNQLVARLKPGEFYQNSNQTQQTMLTSNKPILVAQYSKGFANGDSVGDPMMIVVAPTEQFLPKYRFATPIQGQWRHYVNLIVPTDALHTLRLDGRALDPRQFRPFGISRYSFSQVEVDYGTHTVECSQAFGLYSYGFGFGEGAGGAAYDAYGNGGGQSMVQVVQAPDTIPPSLDATVDNRLATLRAVVRDDRVNDLGIAEITLLEKENLAVTIPTFAFGTPQVPLQIAVTDRKQNSYARFRLRDRAGNITQQTLCIRYDRIGDSLVATVVGPDESCDFSEDLYLGGYVRYSVVDHNATIPAQTAPFNNLVPLNAADGAPAYGFGVHGAMLLENRWHLTGRVGLDFWRADAFGYLPDSLPRFAPDGTPLAEEFQLHRTVAYLMLTPGIQYFVGFHSIYLHGALNIALPISVQQQYRQTILRPANYTYANGEGTLVEYDGGDDKLGLMISPEAGFGVQAALRGGYTVFGELGAGFSLMDAIPNTTGKPTYLFSRFGVKVRM